MRDSVSKLAVSAHVPVEKGAVFELNRRRGTVVETRMTSCLVVWDEFVDPESGEVLPALSDTIANEDFCRYDLHGRLNIIRRPSAVVAEGHRDRSHRSRAEIARMKLRLCFVSAAQQMIIDGDMEETRAGFILRGDNLLGLGTVYYNRHLMKEAGATGKRGGAKVDLGPQSALLESPANIYKWYCDHRRGGPNALFDEYASSTPNAGRRGSLWDEADLRLVFDQQTFPQKVEEPPHAIGCDGRDKISAIRGLV